MYAASTPSAFTPAVREQLHQRIRELETPECPFSNLPEAWAGRWGDGLAAAKMKRLPVVEGSARRTIRISRMDT